MAAGTFHRPTVIFHRSIYEQFRPCVIPVRVVTGTAAAEVILSFSSSVSVGLLGRGSDEAPKD